MRRMFIVGLIATAAAASVDLGACGDKFLRVGRSARFRRYAAVHPAAILIVRPVHSTPAGIEELKALLKQAGHRPVSVDNGSNIASVLATARYDLVIADYADAGQIGSVLLPASSGPAILPILYKPTKAVEAEADKRYAFVIKPHAMTKYDALAEIDRLMESKLDGGSTAAEK
jgi:DNA-binding NtrC family response regulator